MIFHRPDSGLYIHMFSDVEYPKKGYIYERKYNGHNIAFRKNGLPITRHNKPLLQDKLDRFMPSIERAREMIDWDFCTWANAEMMCLHKTSIRPDILVIHDCVGGYSEECVLHDRKELMWHEDPIEFDGKQQIALPERVVGGCQLISKGGISTKKEKEYLRRHKRMGMGLNHGDLLDDLQEQMKINDKCESMGEPPIYEGWVYKKILSYYGDRHTWFKNRMNYQSLAKEEKI